MSSNKAKDVKGQGLRKSRGQATACLSCAAKDRTIKELSAALDELTADFDRMDVVLRRLVAIEEARR